MNAFYNQYNNYLKHLLEVECAEKNLDFITLFNSYLASSTQRDEAKKKLEEAKRLAEAARLAEDKRKKEEAEEAERKRQEAERKRQEAEEKRKRAEILQKTKELERLEEEAFAQCTSLEGCNAYLEAYPEGKHADEVKVKKAQLEAEALKRGDLEFEDGYYVGETRNGLMHGVGTRFWDANGKKWEGHWVDGEACGHMLVTFNDFVVYEGNMEHGLPNGEGKYTDPNSGQVYIGHFVDFKREGEGTLYTEDGVKIYEGEWKNNKYEGYGQYFLRGQCRYEGNWEHGKRNGDGIAYDANGKEEYNGLWKDDSRVNDIDRIEKASQG